MRADPTPSSAPCISVVVPFFDSARFLGACIESLLAQEQVGAEFEIILIDNGSRDGSAAVAQGFEGVVLLEELTPGAYAARNAGIRAARAPIIALTDADCVVDRDWLRSIREGMQDPAAAILVGEVRYPDQASAALRCLGAYENAKAEYVLTRCEPAYQFAYANNMAVRSSVFEELGPFQEWMRAGDTELVHRLAASRPELRAKFDRTMKVTHAEFVRARERARRMSLYTQTNSKIESFRELGIAQRFGILGQLVRRARCA